MKFDFDIAGAEEGGRAGGAESAAAAAPRREHKLVPRSSAAGGIAYGRCVLFTLCPKACALLHRTRLRCRMLDIGQCQTVFFVPFVIVPARSYVC